MSEALNGLHADGNLWPKPLAQVINPDFTDAEAVRQFDKVRRHVLYSVSSVFLHLASSKNLID